MGALVIVTDKGFERVQVSPNHNKTELPGAVRTRCPRQNLNNPVRVPHEPDRSLVEELTKLLFLAGARYDLKCPHDRATHLPTVGRLSA